jgi:transposase-like protein
LGYRIVDKIGKVSHVMLSKRRNKPAATKLLVRAMEGRGLPRKIFFNESAANMKGISDIKRILKHFGFSLPIEMVRISFDVTAAEIRATLVRQLSSRPHSKDHQRLPPLQEQFRKGTSGAEKL